MPTAKKILVTGGAGFIGSNLCKTLIDNDAHVDCVDNLITGRIESIAPLRESKRFKFFKFDITDPDFFRTFLGAHYDEIFHLACPTGVPNIKRFGEEMLETCSIGTDNVLRLACAANAKMLYTSSAEVYGDPEVFPQNEEYCGKVNPVGPRSAYEEGKRFSEAIIESYVAKYDIDAKIVRLFNTFGPGMSMSDSRVIPRFLNNIKKGIKIEIYGDGTQTRTHLYVDDLVAALLTVMARGQRGEVYNIGGDKQLTIAELAETIKRLTPLNVDVQYSPHFIEDHGGRLPSTTKVRKLGWAPVVNVPEGLRRMLMYYNIPVHYNNVPKVEAPTSAIANDALVADAEQPEAETGTVEKLV